MIIPRLLPPDPSFSGTHILAQDSPIKGLRMRNAAWDHTRPRWKLMGFLYGPSELAANSWVYVDAGFDECLRIEEEAEAAYEREVWNKRLGTRA